MTRRRSSPLGLELVLSTLLACMLLPLLTQAAPLQDMTEIQQFTEGCYYNYNHYNEGDRILTNEPCLNCTCHNKMLMCYLRVCPFTKPIGHDCIVEKREDQCCPIITCPEVPVDIAHHFAEPGTELSIPEKYGCSIDEKFYPEGAQVPSNPNKPCELCYCIKNRTSCLMQECTLHIDGCQPIYNKGSCCPVRYNCDHENDVLELEDHSTSTTTTVRPTQGFLLTTTTSPAVTTDCIHNGEFYADGASLHGKNACEHCYCMRGDIVCAVQECEMPMLAGNGKSCHPLPASEGECCPRNYVCEDDTTTTQIIEAATVPYVEGEVKPTTTAPLKDLHSSVSEEDLQLQTHIDDDGQLSTASPEQTVGHGKPIAADEYSSGDHITEPADDGQLEATTAAVASAAADKHEQVDSTTAGAVSKVDESNASTTKTPTVDIAESSTATIENKDAIEATTARIDASETLTEKPEDKAHVVDEGIDSTTSDSMTTKSSVTTEKPTYTADEIMDDNITTEKSEESVEEEDDTIRTTTQHSIDSADDTTESLESTEAAEEETEDSKEKDETSSTTVKIETDVTTTRTEPAKTEANIEMSQTDILKEPEEGSGVASADGAEFDLTTDKVKVESGTQSHKENDIEIVTTYPIFEDDNDVATTQSIIDDDIAIAAIHPKHEDDIEVATKQPNAEDEVVTTQPIAEEEGSGAVEDAEDIESVVTPTTLEDEEHTVGTLTTQKSLIGIDHKAEPLDVTTTNAFDMESTTEAAENKHKHKPEIDQIKQTTPTPSETETKDADQTSQQTTALPALDDDQTITPLTERFDAHDISETSTSSPAFAANEQDSTTLPTAKKESLTTASSLGNATPKDENDITQPSQQTDAIEYTTTSSPHTYVDSSTKPSEDKSVQQTTASDAQLETSTEHLLDGAFATSATEKTSNEIAQTTEQPDSTEDDTSENIFNMPNIPAIIPGEGNCLVGMETYQNNSIVPPSDECELSCKCVSSIIVCQRVQCQAPKNIAKCSLAEASVDKCCPTYNCKDNALPAKHLDEEEQKEIMQATIAPAMEDTVPTTAEISVQQHATTPSAELPMNEVDNKTTVMLPTDIDMPMASTEEPMSHVKDEITEDEQHTTESIPKTDEPVSLATEMPVLIQTVAVSTDQSPIVKPHDDTVIDDSSTPSVEEAIISETMPTIASDKPAGVPESVDMDASLAHTTIFPSSEPTTTFTSDATPVVIADETPVHPDVLLSEKPVTPNPSYDDITTVSSLTEEHTQSSIIAQPQEHSSTTEAPATTYTEEGSGDEDNNTSDDSESETTEGSIEHSNVPDDQTEKVATEDNLADTLDQSEEEKDIAAHTISPASQIKHDETITDIAQTIGPVVDVNKTSAQTTPTILEKHEEMSSTTITIESGDVTLAPTTGFKEVEPSAVKESTNYPFAESTTESVDKTPAVLSEAATNKPVVDEKTETPALSNDGKEGEYIDDSEEHSLAHTDVPSSDKEDIDETTSHDVLLGNDAEAEAVDKSTKKSTTDQPTSHVEGEKEWPTNAPKHDDEKTDSTAHTVNPVDTLEAVTHRPTDEDEEEETTSEVLSHTIKPALDAEKDTTPITEDQQVEHNVVSVSDADEQTVVPEFEKHDVPLSHTTAAPSESNEESTAESTEHDSDQSSTPSTVHAHDESDAFHTHTTPAAESDKETTDSDLMPTTTPATESKEKYEPTRTPVTEASMSAVNDNTIAHTIVPSTANEVEESTNAANEDELTTPSSNQIKDKAEDDEYLSHTDEPDLDNNESTDESLYVPITSSTEKHDVGTFGESTKHPAISIDDLVSITTTPIVETAEKTSDDIFAHTIAPLGDDDKPQDTTDDYLSPDIVANAVDQKKTPSEEDNTLTQTIAPAVDDKNEKEVGVSQTISPVDETEMETIDDHFPHIIAPAAEDIDDTETNTLPPTFDIKKETVEESVTSTSSPVAEDDTLAQTLSTVSVEKETIDGTLVTTVKPVGVDEAVTNDTSSPIDEEKETVVETTAQTPSPIEDVKQTIDDSLSSTPTSTAVEEMENIDATTPKTASPDEGKNETVDDSTAPTSSTAGGENEIVDDTLATTVSSIGGDKEIIEDKLAHTLSPVGVEIDSIDETSAQTSSPVEDEKKTIDDSLSSTTSTINDDTSAPSSKPFDEETDQIDVTLEHSGTTPTIDIDAETMHDLSQTVAPAVENDDDSIAPHDTAPSTENMTDETTVVAEIPVATPIEEQKETTEKSQDHTPENVISDETLATSVSPSSEVTGPAVDADQVPVDEAFSHTVGPVSKDEESVDSAQNTTVSSVDNANRDILDESSTQTVAPIIEQELTTPIPHTHNQATEEPTPIVTAEDKKDVVDDILAHTLSPAIEHGETEKPGEHTDSPIELDIQKESFDGTLSQTASPATEKHDKPIVDFMEHTIAPVLENENESEAVIPSIDDEGQKTIDDPLSQTVYPDIEIVKDITESHTTTMPLKEAEVQTEIVGTSTETNKEIIHATATTVNSLGPSKKPVIEDHSTEAEKEQSDNKEEEDEAIAQSTPTNADIDKELIGATKPTTSTGTPTEHMSETTISSLDENISTTGKPFVPKYDEKIGEENLDTTRAPISHDEVTLVLDAYTTEQPQDGKAPQTEEVVTKLPNIDNADLHTNAPTKEESTTRVPSVVADLEALEETDESIESEEEVTTDINAHKIQHVGEFVTERIEESVSELPTVATQVIKLDEPDSSSQESEEEHVPISDKNASEQTSVNPIEHIANSTLMPNLLQNEKDQESETPAIDDEKQVSGTTQSTPVAQTIKPDSIEGAEETTTPAQRIDITDTLVGEHTEATAFEEDTTKPHNVEAAIESITEDIFDAAKPQEVTEKTEPSEEKEVAKADDSSTSQVDAELSPIATKHPLFPQHTSTTLEPITSTVTNATNISGADELTTTTTASTTTTTTTTEAPVTTTAPTTHYAPPAPPPGYGQPPQYPAYPEDEYTDEDETEVFGPGTCRYGGKLFVSAQQIPRDDPCDFCFCFRSDIICLQQSCPPPISGCHEEPISGFCCPRYECPVSMATTLNITTSTTTTSTTLPPHFLHHAYDGAAQKTGCHINGKSYRVGEQIDSTSGPCMHCTCGGDGQMKCDPKTCSPEPMLRQMIAVVASRRR